MSPALLSKRLKAFETAGIVMRVAAERKLLYSASVITHRCSQTPMLSIIGRSSRPALVRQYSTLKNLDRVTRRRVSAMFGWSPTYFRAVIGGHWARSG